MININQVSKSYKLNSNFFLALQDINLTINRKEVFGILGESGAGKSTLLRLINLLDKPTNGQIYVDGVELAVLSKKQLRVERRKIGMIFQHFNLLQSRTAFENIALPLELLGKSATEIEREVSSLLELVFLVDHKNHYPDQLSGGQKQRVAIARALATKPSVLLCDEPTSALDPKSTLSIVNLLKKINSELNVTIVLATHEMDVIKTICDRAAVLDKGNLIEFGSVYEIFSNPKSIVTMQLVKNAFSTEALQETKN